MQFRPVFLSDGIEPEQVANIVCMLCMELPPPLPPPPIITECERCREIAHNCRIEKSQLPVRHTMQQTERRSGLGPRFL
jgi:hypothetical protein